jgi:hypothetical protein
MEFGKQIVNNDDKKEIPIFRKIVLDILCTIFIFSLIFWIIGFMVLPMVFDGGTTVNALIFILTFLAYPFWGSMILFLIWKWKKPSKKFLFFSIIFLIGIFISIFYWR